PTGHCEMLAIRQAAAALVSERLTDCDLYVTLEPCAMCAAAISFARIRRLYYGAADPKGGAVENGVRFFASPTCHHRPEVYGGIGEAEAAALLNDLFRRRRWRTSALGRGATRRPPLVSATPFHPGGIMTRSLAFAAALCCAIQIPPSFAQEQQQSFKSLLGRGFDIKNVTFVRGEATENREVFVV